MFISGHDTLQSSLHDGILFSIKLMVRQAYRHIIIHFILKKVEWLLGIIIINYYFIPR